MEFAYNNALSATTSISPFFANKGYHLNIIVYPEYNIASFRACNFTIDLNKLQSTLKAEIFAAQQCYQKSANAWCSLTPDFKVGDKVFVKTQFFWTTHPSKKLSKKESEYEISQIVDSKIDYQWACKLLYKVVWLEYEDTGDESK